MNLNQAVTYLAGAVLVPISIAILLLLARKSMRRIVLTFAIATLVGARYAFLAYLFIEGLSGTTLAGSGLIQVVESVWSILAGILVYVSFTASVFALYNSIVTKRTLWFLVLFSTAIISIAAAQIYNNPTVFFPRSPVTFFIGYLGLASVLFYGIVGMRSGRPQDIMAGATPPLMPDIPNTIS